MSRVFMILPHRNVDVGPATQYGELTMLFEEREHRPTFWDPALIDEAMDRLDDDNFDPAQDYFLVAGHMATVVRLACAMARRWPNTRALFWDSIQRCYVQQPLIYTPHDTGYRDDGTETNRPLQESEGSSRGVREGRRRAS